MNMLFFALVIALCIFSTCAEELRELTPSEKSECVNQMLEWCNEMQYPQDGSAGISIKNTFSNEGRYRVYCISDLEGSKCTRNGSPWFACSPDHVLTYKGEVVSEGMTSVDNGICETANKAAKELFVINDYESQARFQEGMDSFYQGMARLQGQMFHLKNMMHNVPMMGGFMSGGMGGDFFGGDFPEFWRNRKTVTLPPSTEQPSKKDSNDIEKE